MSKRKSKTDADVPAGEMLLVDAAVRIVETVPACCPHCRGTRRTILAVIREMQYGGASPGGFERTHIVWFRVTCDHCHGVYAVQQHELRTAE